MSRVGWTISFEGTTYSEGDLTLGAAAKVVDMCGGSWVDLHPLTSPAHFLALLAALMEIRGETTFEEGLVTLSTLNMVKALDMVTPGDSPSDGVVH